MHGCSFCDIVAGGAAGSIVLDEPALVAFLDIRPVFSGHTLIVPRGHVTTLADLPDSLAAPLLMAARRVARALRIALGAEGAFIAMNDVVSQSVPHVHLHVVPRRKGDGLRGFFWPRTGYDGPEHMESVRAAIVAAL
jgi:histidine triad (HIT) family protein